MKRRAVVVTAIVSVGAMFGTACSDDGDKKARRPDRTTTTTAAPTTTTVAPTTTTAAPPTTTVAPTPPPPVEGPASVGEGIGDDVAAITAVVDAASQQQGLQPGQYQVGSIVVSSDGQWATAAVVPSTPGAFQPDRALLRKSGGGWSIVGQGTGEIGCGTGIPAAAAAELEVGTC